MRRWRLQLAMHHGKTIYHFSLFQLPRLAAHQRIFGNIKYRAQKHHIINGFKCNKSYFVQKHKTAFQSLFQHRLAVNLDIIKTREVIELYVGRHYRSGRMICWSLQ